MAATAPETSSLRRITFGTDGWRGIIADDFTFPGVRAAALGIARYLKANFADPSLVVGYDTRFASDRFAAELAAITSAEGVRTIVFDGPAPTQVASWTVIDRRASGAVVITASHNPAPFSGLKYKPDFGGSASPEVVADLETAINGVISSEGYPPSRIDDASLTRIDPRPSYLEQLGRMLDLDALRGAGLKIVHDSMHGAGAGYLAAALGAGRTDVLEMRTHPDPNFGGVQPEPIPANLAASLEIMRAGGQDLAVVSDGDADRLGIIDEKGNFINQLQVFAMLLLYLLEIREWRGPAVRALSSTSMADKLGEIYGIPVEEVRVGFKYVGPAMMKSDAIIGGEESGGFGFRGHIPERDGILAGLFFADMILRWDRPLSECLAHLESKVGKHFYDRIDVHLPRDDYAARKARIYAAFSADLPSEVAGRRVVRSRDDDGFKLYFEGGDWVLVRGSGTEPMMRIYAEATAPETVSALLAEMRQRMEAVK